jgi:anaerobic selenocysteine-containing dehydrogenase
VAPPGECLPNTEVFRRLARHMCLEEPALYHSDEQLARRLLASGDPALEGITLERLRRNGFARLNVGRPFRPFAGGVPTPSGRFELWCERAAADGHDPLAGYVAPAESGVAGAADGDGGAPLALISPASPWFLNSVFANSDAHRAKAGAPVVELHPHDAAARGLSDGEEVEVANDRGAFRAVLRVTDAVRPGVAASPKGRWPKLTGGATVNATTAERDADLGRGAVYHDNAVVVRRVAAAAGVDGAAAAAHAG